MNLKLDPSEQVRYGNEAQAYAKIHGVTFLDACTVIIAKHNLPIAAKTLANNYASHEAFTRAMNEAIGEDSDYNTEAVIDELQKELKKTKRKLLEQENRNQLLVYHTVKSTKAISRNCIQPACEGQRNDGDREEIAMLDLSDLHLGKKIDTRDTAGLNYYDQAVFEEQCRMMIVAIEEIVSIQRRGGISLNNIYINCLGDLVDGELIYSGHQSEICRGIIDQMYEFGDYFLKTVLAPLGEIFDKVTILSVDGNHGRVGNRKDGFDRKLNFDNILLRFWQQRLQNYQDVFEFNISESPYMLYYLLGKLHLLHHGHRTGSARNPMLGIERFLHGVSTLNRQVVDYVHLAHFHRDIKFNFNFSEILVNGSWVGPTEFTVGQMAAGDFPFQRFYGLNEKHITWTYPIYLDKHITGTVSSLCQNNGLHVLTPTVESVEPLRVRRSIRVNADSVKPPQRVYDEKLHRYI